jgi:hypothetical protein
MNIRQTLHNLFNEDSPEAKPMQYANPQDPEEQRFIRAIQQELDEELEQALADDLPSVPSQDDMSPEERLDNIMPDIADAYMEKSSEESDLGKARFMATFYLEKAKSGLPVESILHNMEKHFFLDAALRGKIESILHDAQEVDEDPTSKDEPEKMLEKAHQYLEMMMPDIVVAYKPAYGQTSEEYAERARNHFLSYIQRVNGCDVDIDRMMLETKALFNMCPKTEKKIMNVYKMASGLIDDDARQFMTEMDEAGKDVEEVDEPKKSFYATGDWENFSRHLKTPKKLACCINEEEDGEYCMMLTGKWNDLYNKLVNTDTIECLACGLHEDAYDMDPHQNIFEGLHKAVTMALKQGVECNKPEVVKSLMKIMEETMELDEDSYSLLETTLEEAYALGEKYGHDILRIAEQGPAGSVDMTITREDALQAFSDIPEEEQVIEPVGEMPKPEVEPEDPIKKMFEDRIGRIFEQND